MKLQFWVPRMIKISNKTSTKGAKDFSLFILIIEELSNILEDFTQQEGYCYHPRCQQLSISHVIFADDLFFLSGTNSETFRILKGALEEFGYQSGLRPNR